MVNFSYALKEAVLMTYAVSSMAVYPSVNPLVCMWGNHY